MMMMMVMVMMMKLMVMVMLLMTMRMSHVENDDVDLVSGPHSAKEPPQTLLGRGT